MNRTRRAVVRDIIDKLIAFQSEIEECRDQEQDYFDAMPEAFQDGAKGQAAELAVDALDSAANDIENVVSALQEAIGD